MAELCVIIEPEMPKRLYATFDGYTIRPLSRSFVVAIEDYLFTSGDKQVKLSEGPASVVIVPGSAISTTSIDEDMVLVEFALALSAAEGHPLLRAGAILSGAKCTSAKIVRNDEATVRSCTFPRKLNGVAAAQWLRRCFLARTRLKDRLHVTAHRYIKYARSKAEQDALLDLTISLESLVDSQAEIAWRFAASLSKVTGARGKEAEKLATILHDLYDVRSRIVHGDRRASELAKKIAPNLADLHYLARRILTTYVLYTSEKTYDEWKDFLRVNLYA